MNKWFILIIVVLVGFALGSYKYSMEVSKKLDISMANIKAYDMELIKEKEKSTAFQLTIEQLNGFSDSILMELINTKEELNIKDKNLKALQSVKTQFSKLDTIVIKDTIFKSPSLSLDTVLSDEWYSLRVGLKYPSTIAVKPEFRSEKHIIVSTKRETVDPPKKFFLLRLFQKRHTVLEVNVKEKNPYIDSQTSRYIEILK